METGIVKRGDIKAYESNSTIIKKNQCNHTLYFRPHPYGHKLYN